MSFDDELSSSNTDSDHSLDAWDMEDVEPLDLLVSPSIPLATDLSVQQLREILKTSQMNHQALFGKYKSLVTKHERLLASFKAKKSKGAERGSLSGEEKEISLAGGRFSVIGEPWVARPIFAIPFPRNVDPLDPTRYANKTSEDLGIIAELYRSLPKHLQKALANDNRRDAFREIFLKQLSQERANSAHAVRLHAARILRLDTQLFEKNFNRAEAPELRKLLENPAEPGKRYPILAPLIFPDHDVQSIHPFRCDALATFLRVILYGPSSLANNGGATSSSSGKRASKGVLWGVKETTPGMIALAATLLTFACSPDQIFSDKSRGPSGIDWKYRFTLNKRAILCFPSGYRKSLLSWYNNKLFGTVTTEETSNSYEDGLEGVYGLVARVQQVEITDLSEPSAPPPMLTGLTTPLTVTTPEPDLPPMPSPTSGQTGQHTQVCAVPLDQFPVLPPVGHATSEDTPSNVPVQRASQRKKGKGARR
ncbi:hypothetical protein H4582DRAFT_2102612 [Lactarius indigo]|nr:hypothetical protein H4582DRAFT_2102612 [Lactarius indigo]